MVFHSGIYRIYSENFQVFSLGLIPAFNLFLKVNVIWAVQGRYLLNFRLKTSLQAGQIREDGTNCRLHIKIDHV